MSRKVSANVDMAFISHILSTSLDKPLEPHQVEYPLEEQPALDQSPSTNQNTYSVWRELGALLLKIIAIVLTFAIIFTFMYGLHRNMDAHSGPMVKSGDVVMFYRLDKEYSIGDLLVLNFEGERQVRRVVAREGDVVDITENGLSINGALQQEPEIFEETLPYENGVAFPLTVGKNQVFVLGDARENATDSRVYGPVDIADTFGTVITTIRRRNF